MWKVHRWNESLLTRIQTSAKKLFATGKSKKELLSKSLLKDSVSKIGKLEWDWNQ